MMKRLLCAGLLALLLPVCAAAEIEMTETESEGSRLVTFSIKADQSDVQPNKEPSPDPVSMAIDMQIEARFAQEKAAAAAQRAGAAIVQEGKLYQDGRIASMARTWQGEQADGMDGSSADALTIWLETGREIYLDELFADYEGALAAMEKIITCDVLQSMSDYMEFSDLLPMPENGYSVDEWGLTVYWPQERYRYFDGTSGSVTFYWHELADYIGEASPVYALAHPDIPDNPLEIEAACMNGSLSGMLSVKLGEQLGEAAQRYALADPDYTTDALVYPLERARGWSVEIPKYAQTQAEETPISALRAARTRLAQLITGKTTDMEARALLGEPAKETVYDEDAAFDAMLEPGVSLFYEISGRVLQLHFDESGVLCCLILRSAMPESLY